MNRQNMLDTNTVSYIVKGNSPSARAKLAALRPEEVACILVITEAELQYGLAKSRNAQTLRPSLEGLLAKIQILAWGREGALAYGLLRAKQAVTGKALGNLDMLIAAHAIAIAAVLVTSDRAFSRVRQLSATVNWATDLQ